MTTVYLIGLLGAVMLTAGGAGLLYVQLAPAGGAVDLDERRRAAARRATDRAEAARRKKIRSEAEHLRNDVIAELASLKFSYTYERRGAMRRMAKVQIKEVFYSDDAVWMRIHKLPFGVYWTQLATDETARNLSIALGRECRWIAHRTDVGLFLQISLATGIHGVPRRFAWHDDANAFNALERLPASDPFRVVIGAGENRRVVSVDVRELPHLIVAGATGGGKSVFLNQMICTLIKRNPPRRLQLLLVDLKGGLEFSQYRDVPHLMRPIAEHNEDVAPILQWMIDEKERRFALLKRAGVRKIQAYNAGRPAGRLPYVILIFDEIANLMQAPELKKRVQLLMSDVAQQGRALGLHMILCTQIPNRDVITGLIKGNIPRRIAFATDHHGSMTILGNARAKELPTGGRAVYKDGHTEIELQAPLITEEQMTATIREVCGLERLSGDETGDLTDDQILRTVLDELGGRFARRLVYDHFAGRVTVARINEMGTRLQYDYDSRSPILNISGGSYVLAIPPGRRGRQLIAIDSPPASPDELTVQ